MYHRIERLRAALAESSLPALLVGAPANRRYLSGFTASYGWLLVTPTDAFVLTDSRYRIQAAREAPGFGIREIVNPGRTMPAVLADLAAELGLNSVAFEAAHTSVADLRRLAKALGDTIELLPTEGIVEEQRQVKDEAEIVGKRGALLRYEAQIGVRSLHAIVGYCGSS